MHGQINKAQMAPIHWAFGNYLKFCQKYSKFKLCQDLSSLKGYATFEKDICKTWLKMSGNHFCH